MAFSYDIELGTTLDKVRFYLSDISESGALFRDETIEAVLAIYNDDALQTAAALADSLVARFSKSVSFSIEGLSIQNAQKAENYRLLAARLRGLASGATTSGALGVMGVSVGEMRAEDRNTDRPASAFKVGMNDYPGTSHGPEGCGPINE